MTVKKPMAYCFVQIFFIDIHIKKWSGIVNLPDYKKAQNLEIKVLFYQFFPIYTHFPLFLPYYLPTILVGKHIRHLLPPPSPEYVPA